MISLLEYSVYRAHRLLGTLTELVEMSDPDDEMFHEILEEKRLIEVSLINPSVSLNNALKKSKYGTAVRGSSVSYLKAPRVVRVYFDNVDEVQAQGFGMRKDGDEWYINTWNDKVDIIHLNDYVKSKGIPFQISRYNIYGGRVK